MSFILSGFQMVRCSPRLWFLDHGPVARRAVEHPALYAGVSVACREVARMQPKLHVLQTRRYSWFPARPVTMCLFVFQAGGKARLMAGKMQHLPGRACSGAALKQSHFSLGKQATHFSLVSAFRQAGSLDTAWKECPEEVRRTRIIVTRLTPPRKGPDPLTRHSLQSSVGLGRSCSRSESGQASSVMLPTALPWDHREDM